MPARDEILKLILSAAESRRFNWEISLSFTMQRARYVTVLVPVEAHSCLLSVLGSHAEADISYRILWLGANPSSVTLNELLLLPLVSVFSGKQ